MTRQPKPIVEIDPGSGFCFGVTAAINKAEEVLRDTPTLYCLGDIVHNNAEVERLGVKGLKTITHNDLESQLHTGDRVLLRAHGEPPSTYASALSRGISIVDATCPVVLKLQHRIKETYDRSMDLNRPLQIVIYGQKGHAEVNGLVGQTNGTAIVIENTGQLDQLDYGKDIMLFSQTTKPLDGFNRMVAAINSRMHAGAQFGYADTICRQVANRVQGIKRFAASHDVVIFVAGRQSSNGRVLYGDCVGVNPRTHMVQGPRDIDPAWLEQCASVGICGATSTPRWLMEDTAARVHQLLDSSSTDPYQQNINQP